MVSITSLLTSSLALSTAATATPVPKKTNETVVTYLGTQGPILSSGASTSKSIVYTAGNVPSQNGTIVSGGIGPQTEQVLTNIAALLAEAGTSWAYALKTTVFLASMDDYDAMNAVYGAFLPDPKPARTAVEVGRLPGDFLVEIEAIAAIPDCLVLTSGSKARRPCDCGRLVLSGLALILSALDVRQALTLSSTASTGCRCQCKTRLQSSHL